MANKWAIDVIISVYDGDVSLIGTGRFWEPAHPGNRLLLYSALMAEMHQKVLTDGRIVLADAAVVAEFFPMVPAMDDATAQVYTVRESMLVPWCVLDWTYEGDSDSGVDLATV